MEASTIALHYFDIQGPAEPARLALVVGGVPFEDGGLGQLLPLSSRTCVYFCCLLCQLTVYTPVLSNAFHT